MLLMSEKHQEEIILFIGHSEDVVNKSHLLHKPTKTPKIEYLVKISEKTWSVIKKSFLKSKKSPKTG